MPTENQPDERFASPITRKLVDGFLKGWPIRRWGNAPWVVAVSGGADSVALVRLLLRVIQEREQPQTIIVTHVNHGLRGEASDRDQRFVEELAARWNLPCEVLPKPARLTRAGEEALRTERYRFLQAVAAQRGARYVLTAHHRDDQLETLLFRMFRGTSAKGLAGMRRFRPLAEGVTLARPLLDLPREDLLRFLQELEQPFREDATNADDVYTRNFIRHRIWPLVRERFGPEVDDRVHQLQQEFVELNQYLGSQATEALTDLCSFDNTESPALSLYEARRLPLLILREALVSLWSIMGWPAGEMTRKHWGQLVDFLVLPEQESITAIQFPGAIDVRRGEEAQIILSRQASTPPTRASSDS